MKEGSGGSGRPPGQGLGDTLAGAANLREQLQLLLSFALARTGAACGLAAHVDRATRRFQVMAAAGMADDLAGSVIEPSSAYWELLQADGVVRKRLIFPGAKIGANLFVPTADPALHRAVVHVEWTERQDVPAGAVQEVQEAYRQVSNLVRMAEKAFNWERLHRRPEEDDRGPDPDLDEPDVSRLLPRILDRLQQELGVSNAAIFLAADDEGNLLLLPAGFRGDLALNPATLPRTIRRRAGRAGSRGAERRRGRAGAPGVPFVALETGENYVSPDLEKDPNYTPFFSETRSCVSVPLVFGARRIGIVQVEARGAAAFNGDFVARLELLAREWAVYVGKALLYQESKSEGGVGVLVVGVQPRILEQALTVGGARATVLLGGETGTGKEMIARLIHFAGPRHAKPFLTLNGPEIAPTLIESEIFGHVKGAFTGAEENKQGIFEKAQGGTVFIDEIHALSIEQQRKLHRALERNLVVAVGSAGEERHFDARCIVASSQNLFNLVEKGQFLPDLYYRLDVASIQLPPLRERRGTILGIAEVLVREMAERNGKSAMPITPAAQRLLRDHDYRGNIRELRNIIEQAVVWDKDGKIDMDDLPPRVTQSAPVRMGDSAIHDPRLVQAQIDVEERNRLITALKRSKGNVAQAADLYQVDRRKFYRLLEKLGIDPNEYRARRADGK